MDNLWIVRGISGQWLEPLPKKSRTSSRKLDGIYEARWLLTGAFYTKLGCPDNRLFFKYVVYEKHKCFLSIYAKYLIGLIKSAIINQPDKLITRAAGDNHYIKR